jgi:hypothetical protein
MKTKKEFQEFLDDIDNFNYFINLIHQTFKNDAFIELESSNDFDNVALILTELDYKRLNVPLFNIKEYQSYNCIHEYDCYCCGGISSQEIQIVNNKNGYVSIFINTYYNY